MEYNNERPTSTEKEQRLRTYSTVMTILFLLALGGIIYLAVNRYQVKTDLSSTSTERDSLLVTRTNLENEVDSLSSAFANALAENDDLQGSMTDMQKMVAEKEAQIRQIRTQSTNTAEGLRKQVNQLQQIRGEMEGALGKLTQENTELRADNERLTGENTQLVTEKGQLSGQVADMQKFNSTLQNQVAKLTRAGVKASAFRVEVERRSNKLTTSARRTREVSITFDLVDLPEEFQGEHTLYLALTDVNGALLATGGTNTKASIPTPSGTNLEVVAQQTKQVNLAASQRLSFSYNVEEKLKAGTYVATVYADFGILGSSSFRLN